jgi:hypothetical protein
MRPSTLAQVALLAIVWIPSSVQADGTWSRQPPPAPRFGHGAVFDAARQRMLVFGGTASTAVGSNLSNDVWALSLSGTRAWTPIAPAGTPPSARFGHSMILDPVRDQLVVFGGSDNSGPSNQVWTMSLSGAPTWTQLAPAGTAPGARFGHSAVYDPVGDRMVIFGGQPTGSAPVNDVWALSLSGTPAWTHLTPSGTPPSGRSGAGAAYDDARGRLLLFGGEAFGSSNDVWALSLSGGLAWTQLTPAGSPPSARGFPAAIYDATRDEFVVMGGLGATYLNDVWTLSLSGSPTWSQLAPAGSLPGGRDYHTAVLDPVHDRIEVFSGYAGAALSDLWELSRAAGPVWASVPASGASPSGRNMPSMTRDPSRDRMIVVGGWDGSSDLNDVWALPLATGQAWEQLAPLGTPPAPREGHTTIYDPVRDRMILFGGVGGGHAFNDVWGLSFSGAPTWTLLTPLGTPPNGRRGHSAIYDPVRDRMLVFGGVDASGYYNDVWALSLAGTPTWARLAPTGAPPSQRYSQSAIHDPLRDRMVIFGGDPINNDTWALSLGTSPPKWVQLLPANPPVVRYGHTAIYDPARDRMVIFGGKGPGVDYRNDVWALPLASATAWTDLAPTGTALPVGRLLGGAIYDAWRDRMVVFGGYTYDGVRGTNLGDLWAVQWAGDVSAPPSATAALRLAPAHPNPARDDVVLEFALPARGDAVLRVFDVSGRVVRTLVQGVLAEGRHSVRWDRRATSGALVQPGLYFYELCAGGQRLSRRVAVAQ